MVLSACDKKPELSAAAVIPVTTRFSPAPKDSLPVKEVPVLCYHNFSGNRNSGITLSRKTFEAQMKSLADSGYQSILPEDLYGSLTQNRILPRKPVIISFDDTRLGQYTIALPILEKYGSKGVFFIMTVCINKPGYMSARQLKDIFDRGHCIAAHTYDHPSIGSIENSQWFHQLREPKDLLERITGRPVDYFAYPNGSWNEKYIEQLKNYGYKGAFQLLGRISSRNPVYTIRRLMVQGNWSPAGLHRQISSSFHWIAHFGNLPCLPVMLLI